jgi:hypothetical protein
MGKFMCLTRKIRCLVGKIMCLIKLIIPHIVRRKTIPLEQEAVNLDL